MKTLYPAEESGVKISMLSMWEWGFSKYYLSGNNPYIQTFSLRNTTLIMKYNSSKFRRNDFPLLVLFRKRGMTGVCLHKEWGK